MADVKISALPAATVPLAGTEVLPIVQSATTRQVSVANLTAGRAISASSITNSALTSGRVTYAGASGLLSDSANLAFDGNNLIVGSGSSSAIANKNIDVNGTGDAAFVLRVGGTTTSYLYSTAGQTILGTVGALPITFNPNGTERMRITSAGNVGIGTSSPVQKLQVNGAAGNPATSGSTQNGLTRLSNTTDNGVLDIGIKSGGTGAWLQSTDGGASGLANQYPLLLNPVGGNVGIGTSSPSQLLHLNVASGAVYELISSGSNNLYLGYENTRAVSVIQSNNALVFDVGSGYTERMRIDSSGNLLVGTTSTITGTKFGATSTTTSGAGEFYVNSAGADAINAINIIKYSTTNTTAQQFIGFTINNANTGSGQINANGASQAAFGSFSDARLKENIVDLPSQLNNILALKPKEFDYIQSEGGGHQIGFVAQDMQTVYPDAISERTDGMLVVTGWSKTEARLVKAIQEQQALIESLTTRLTALENK